MATAGVAVAAMTTLTMAVNDEGCLRKRKGEGAGPTWLPMKRVQNQYETKNNQENNIFWGEAGRLEEYQKGVLGVI